MKRLSLLIILACLLPAGIVQAQILPSSTPEADSIAFARVRERMDSIRQYRPTVGLVLAGGGARGLAHLGVIKYMEELGIPVDLITGTSMGGLVGGLYALGYKHDQLDSLVRAINWPVMMSDNIPNDYIGYQLRKYRERFLIRIPWKYDDEDLADRMRREKVLDKMSQEAGLNSTEMMNESINKMGIGMPDGYLYGLNVRNMLSSVSVGYQDSISFADLPIPYANVATDLYAMTPKYWTGGDITAAMRSTMAIPFYFRAVRGDGAILLDGGMRNNFPVDLAKEMGADIIIGSEMSTNRKLDELNSPMDFLFQTISLLASTAMGPAMEMLDLDVHHELEGYNMLSFDDASVDDIINQGYRNALEHKELFESIAKLVADKPEPDVVRHAPAINLALKKVRVDKVLFTGIKEDDQDKILHDDDYPRDGMYNRDIIERLLNEIYGTNVFESVTYHLEGSCEPYTLVFDCQKGQVNDSALSLRADTDEYVSAIIHLGLGTRRLAGPRFAADLKLGTNPYFNLDFSLKSKVGLPTVGLSLRNKLLNATSGYMGDVNDKLFSSAVDLYLSDSRMHRGTMKLGFTAEMDPYEHYLSYKEEWSGWDWQSFWLSAFANLKVDTFDDGYFPTRGLRFTLDGRYVFKGYCIDLDPERYHESEQATTADGSVPAYLTTLASFEAALSLGPHFTILPKLYAGWYNANEQDYLNPKHIVSIGGFMRDRYVERQIPFFGFPVGYRSCWQYSVSAQLDLRYCFARKNFLTLRGGLFEDAAYLSDFKSFYPVYAFGAEYARQTLAGPFKLAVQYCNIVGVSVYAGVGFEF